MDMKKHKLFFSGLIFLGLTFLFPSCKEEVEEKKEAKVTFGANYHIVSFPTCVTVFLDGEKVGTLEKSSNSIIECG
jgi:hypothetical protein